jgi:NAD(P)-dependent dehydrogenase (short-subunit alcohol dehydrogenase family)
VKTWFVTGAGRGLGAAFARAALDRGDRVAATARSLDALEPLVAAYGDAVVPLALDVRSRADALAAVGRAVAVLGHLDVVVNNAGYGQFGAVEELSEADLREQLETNLYGAVWVTQAALPHLRAQGSGHVVQVSSIGGVGAFANLGAYHASKWALEAISESLAAEVAPYGVHVTLLEPGGYATDWSGASARHADPLPAYEPMREAARARRGAAAEGSPEGAARALLELVDLDEPPLRALVGAAAPGVVRGIYERRLAEWAAGESRAVAAQA